MKVYMLQRNTETLDGDKEKVFYTGEGKVRWSPFYGMVYAGIGDATYAANTCGEERQTVEIVTKELTEVTDKYSDNL